ncbi:hypothetical protein GW17_00003582 [Ensete ventricosum]|nr:hypothetical protein GW17_00003582 [Ensete ventricosum]RZR78293.1 hypothetical protein BHM03_00003588 [Ensete ventricosum]
MDAKRGEESVVVGAAPQVKEGVSHSNSKGSGSLDGKDMFVRADKIDLRSLDIQLEKTLSKIWLKERRGSQKPSEEWEINLSKLEIRYVIARGTYGTVYRGVYDGQDVAGTYLPLNFGQNLQLRYCALQFVGASMWTSDLKIPQNDSLSTVHSSLPTRACCVVVEYLAGGTLKQYLIKNRRRKLPFKIVIQVALDLARGLSYLHSEKIVHRDVKTENMLLDTNRKLKIADFGVARVEAQNPRDMTGETGTLGYMAPEVLDGKPYNRRCDVYSFGICLWEIYCCDMPYADLSFVDVSSAVVRQKCWDANPDKRLEMSEVVKLLEAIDTSKGGGMVPEDRAAGCLCFSVARGP